MMTNVLYVYRNKNSCCIKIPKDFLYLDCFSNRKVNFIGRSDFSIRLEKCINYKYYRKDVRILNKNSLCIPKDLCRIFNISVGDKMLIYTSEYNKQCFIKKYE